MLQPQKPRYTARIEDRVPDKKVVQMFDQTGKSFVPTQMKPRAESADRKGAVFRPQKPNPEILTWAHGTDG